MKRLSRKNITDIDLGILTSGGMFDLVDNAIKESLRITDNEYDFIVEKTTDEELNLLIKENKTFSDKRKLSIILNKYLELYSNQK